MSDKRTSNWKFNSFFKRSALPENSSDELVNLHLMCKDCKRGPEEQQSEQRGHVNEVKRTRWKMKTKTVMKFVARRRQLTAQEISDFTCAAAKGNLEEFQRLYENDPIRLTVQDSKGFSPIHKAAEFGRVSILNFIKEKGGDLNIQDKCGNTALHIAVKYEKVACINYLLENGANACLLNDDHMAPIHLAVDLNATKSLKALLSHNGIDPNLKGEKGMMPLHYCAIKDRSQCATMLLENGAKPCNKCDNGFFPINVAGKCAAAKTLEVLIRHVEALGYKREDILTFSDKENNMPLHCAVNSGDLKAVEVCLSAGAPCDAKQEDNSTPLHFACAQGSVDMVKLMHAMQPERFQAALHTQDVLKMSPLHRAALFDHVAVVQFLVDNGAEINAPDMHDRTPLLLASSKGGWRTVHYLLQKNADITLKDKENRNFLHLAIKYGVPFDSAGCALIKDLKNLLNERDDLGCTPLHYASKEGYLLAIDDLIKLGADISPKDNDKKSPLHFAAKYGRYNTCKRLLDSAMGPNIINETDGDGLSTLHIAAQNGHTKIITLLMQKGAYVTKDDQDNTPLHLAAANGYTRSAKLLLTVYPNLLDCANKDGNTALHLASKEHHPSMIELLLTIGATFTKNANKDSFMDIAIRERHSEVALAILHHERWEEALEMCSYQYGTPMNGLVQCLPDACMAALDRCQTTSKHDRRSPDYFVHYNFKYLQCPLRWLTSKNVDSKEHTPMVALNTMVRHGRVRCLSHPVSEAFLNMKWRAYGSWFHISNLIIYVIFLANLTVLVTTCTYALQNDTFIKQTVIDGNISNSQNIGNQTNNATEAPRDNIITVVRACKFNSTHRISVFVVLIFCSLNILKEIVQIFQQRARYFQDLTNLLEWVLYISVMLYITPFLCFEPMNWQWETGAIAVFLAWFNCLLFLQRFDFFGIYVVMFLEILRTLLQVLCVFSILLIAFGMAFFMLLNKEENRAFSSPTLSLLRTAMMMLELDYMASFNEPYTDNDPKTLYFGGITFALLATFVLLMPILLMNLLIGLAVGDIVSVQKNATLKRLAMQVELHTNLERKLPLKILNFVDKSEYTHYPNKCMGHLEKIWSKMSFLGDSLDVDLHKTTSHQERVYQELYKHKLRMKDITSNLSKQYELLRLIVQKMEIHTEEDNKDEGVSDSIDSYDSVKKASQWEPLKHNLLRQSAVLAHWKNSVSCD